MKKYAIPAVILASVLWFVPERSFQALTAVTDLVKAAGPGRYPVPGSSPSSEGKAPSESQP